MGSTLKGANTSAQAQCSTPQTVMCSGTKSMTSIMLAVDFLLVSFQA